MLPIDLRGPRLRIRRAHPEDAAASYRWFADPTVTAEASYHAPYDHCTVKYLEQAAVHPTWIKLADVGIRGNGHLSVSQTRAG